MIPIVKPVLAPAILRNRGVRTTDGYKNDYDASPADYDSGAKKFDFDSSLYGAKSVKNALIKAQYSKCAFCESKFSHIAYGDVEHFRPKGGYKQNDGDELKKPGYYWLAYEWSNLYAACQICNQRFKKNLFPLANPANRAKNHNDNVAIEASLLVDPGAVDPQEFIGFRQHYPFAIDGNPVGRATINVVGLDREEIATVREDQFRTMELFRDSRDELRSMIDDSDTAENLRRIDLLERIEARISDFQLDSAEYAAMARAVFSE